MLQKYKLMSWVCILYAVITALFIVFFVFVDRLDSVSVEAVRSTDAYCRVENYTVEEVADPDAPIGIQQVYRWTLPDIQEGEESCVFYTVHQYAQVYIDDTLIYRLMPMDTNRIGKSVGCNWVNIPLDPKDSGKEIRVVVTPVYQSVRDRQVVYQIGAPYQIYMNQLRKDFPQLFLSIACCISGFVITLVLLVQLWRRQTQNWFILFMGNFTTLLGIWKLTDTRFSSVLFESHVILISYLSIGAVFLGAIAAALFLCDRFTHTKFNVMPAVAILTSGGALMALALQILGIADFKEILPVAHFMIMLVALGLAVSVAMQKRQGSPTLGNREWLLFVLLAAGASGDLMVYYTMGTSENLLFTLVAVLLYTVWLFVNSLTDARKRAFTDSLSGLFNKSRWDSLVNNPSIREKQCGVIMFDLNRLKYVNDTMGHEAGDRMIVNFANILRNTIPPTETICRWGGDEFTVLSTDASREKLEGYLLKIRTAAAAYNMSGQTPELHFAAGYALATEFPGQTPAELLMKADERMYCDKRRWYAEHR